jgi:4'-phosphopantetheinyl transferase
MSILLMPLLPLSSDYRRRSSGLMPSTSQWLAPPESLDLQGNEVHVWRAVLDQPHDYVQSLMQILADDEAERAEKFYFPRDRTRFTVTRATLRMILGRYLSCEPSELGFSYSQYGKPALAGEFAQAGLTFNLAHSAGMALYALARDQEIGVDVEHMRAMEYEQVSERFFSPHEVQALRSLPPEARQEAFFRCWTRKEAYLKARGMGLSLALDMFDVSLAPGEPPALLDIREEGQEPSCWSLYDLSFDPGYAAALAIKGHPSSVCCWQWL